jgi:hypothetical protein
MAEKESSQSITMCNPTFHRNNTTSSFPVSRSYRQQIHHIFKFISKIKIIKRRTQGTGIYKNNNIFFFLCLKESPDTKRMTLKNKACPEEGCFLLYITVP